MTRSPGWKTLAQVCQPLTKQPLLLFSWGMGLTRLSYCPSSLQSEGPSSETVLEQSINCSFFRAQDQPPRLEHGGLRHTCWALTWGPSCWDTLLAAQTQWLALVGSCRILASEFSCQSPSLPGDSGGAVALPQFQGPTALRPPRPWCCEGTSGAPFPGRDPGEIGFADNFWTTLLPMGGASLKGCGGGVG